ncbi:universal stress protein [Streptomyces sp. NBC_01497]|uniref:universal stress protein n=1 Tax=Streptomyces sp. NBC_01497 TaxID=2903885 RepID=UPI002E2FE276|nr:universal stress protein [Streptomyces sp. NBC_01497]
MTVIAWIVEGTWPACVDAVRSHAPDGASLTLLHVSDIEVPGVAHGAFAGLLGRGRAAHDPGRALEDLEARSAAELLAEAAERLGRPCATRAVSGRVEREVVAAARDADLLVLARDGDRERLGPHSLGPASRFVVDHAPCQVLLVWPESAPDLTTMPPEPPEPPGPHGPPPAPPAPPRRP